MKSLKIPNRRPPETAAKHLSPRLPENTYASRLQLARVLRTTKLISDNPELFYGRPLINLKLLMSTAITNLRQLEKELSQDHGGAGTFSGDNIFMKDFEQLHAHLANLGIRAEPGFMLTYRHLRNINLMIRARKPG
jgi:hypothetical protein